MNPRQAEIGRKVVIIGTTCSGKTTLAGCLARCYRLPHIELDALHWGPNWTPYRLDEFRAAVTTALAGDGWIVEGNYSKVRDLVWSPAETLIWLDYPLPLLLWRQVVRGLRRSLGGEELWNGNRESLRTQFLSRDSLILWALKSHHRRRRQYPLLFQEPAYAHLQVIRLRSPRILSDWLAEISCPP